MNLESHVNDLDLAAFLDGGLDPEARLRVEVHLLECEACRQLVAATGGLLAQPVRRARRRILWGGATAAAAAAVLLAVVTRPRDLDPVSRTRDTEVVRPSGLGFAPAAPPEGALVLPDTLSFWWTSLGVDATYQLTVSSEAGAIVWSQRTTDTVLALPRDAASRLEAGRAYYWQVDAVLPDLRSSSTGPRQFTTVIP